MTALIINPIVGTLALLVSIVMNAHASSPREGEYIPKGYVAICQQGNQMIVEPYEIHEARVKQGRTPYSSKGKTLSEIVRESSYRLRPYSARHADTILESINSVLVKGKFIDNVDLVPDEGEVIPSPLAPGCKVKKLFKYHPPQLPFEYIFNGSLWNALSSFGQVVALSNIAFSLPCGNYCNGGSLSGLGDAAAIRQFTALVFSADFTQLAARDWFAELRSIQNQTVVFKGVELYTNSAQFSDETGSIQRATAKDGVTSYLSFNGNVYEVHVLGAIEFYPNGNIHWFRPDYFPEVRISFLGGSLMFSPWCRVELSEDQKLVQACLSSGALRAGQSRLSVMGGGHVSFYPSGFVKSAVATAVVKLGGRDVEVSSSKSSDGTGDLHFDGEGNILDGTLKAPTKFNILDSEFILADAPFTAYPGGQIKSGRLAADAQLKDCTGVTHLYRAGTELHFNEAGTPCWNQN